MYNWELEEKKRLKGNFVLVLCEMGMFWQKKSVWYCNTTRNFSFWILLATLLISGKKIFVRNLNILSEYLSLWTLECGYFWVNDFYATENCERGDTLLLLSHRGWGLIFSQRLCKRDNWIFTGVKGGNQSRDFT